MTYNLGSNTSTRKETLMTQPTPHAPMTLDQIAAELRGPIQKIPRTPVSNRLGRWAIRAVMKLMPDAKVEGVQLDKRTISGGIQLRVYTPTENPTGAALLWIHGGGMVIGSATQDDRFCAETARDLGIVVVSTDYRLAPESPFPAALDDVYAAWSWLQDAAAQLKVDKARAAVGGESAGGGLAASLVQRIHDAGGVQPIAQWLFCPMLDDRTAANRALDVIGHKIWDNQQNRVGWRSFLGTEPGAESVPAYAVGARRQDVRGLPPAWIGTGDIELFFEEDVAYAERLNAAGVACTLDIVPGAPHGFQTVARDTQLARDYVTRARTWLREVVAQSVQ